jgi:protein TonB
VLDQPPAPELRVQENAGGGVAPTLGENEDLPPVVISKPLPAYTSRARQLRQEGKVTLRVLIDETGHVVQSELVSGIPRSDLNEAALQASKQWVYKPARRRGVPISYWKTEVVVFKL